MNARRSRPAPLILTVFILAFSPIAFAGDPAADARHYFANQPRLEAFRQAVLKELDMWLEGMGGEAVGRRRPGISHLEDSVVYYWSEYDSGYPAVTWNTGIVPSDFKQTGRDVTFAWVFGTRTRPTTNPVRLLIDGHRRFEFRIPADRSFTVRGIDAGEFRFDSIYEESGGAKYGYARVTIPDKWLTAGRSLRMRLESDMVDDVLFPRVFPYTDTVAALKAGPRDTFSLLTAGTQPDEPLRLSVAARPEWAGRQVELRSGKSKPLGRAKLVASEDGKISQTTISVPGSAGVTPEMAELPFHVFVDDKRVDNASISPMVLSAPTLLARYRAVVQSVRGGQVPAADLRDAAMVLARGELLDNLIRTGGRADVLQRAGFLEDACTNLGEALAAFETSGDSLVGKKQSMYSAYISRADGSGQIYVLYVPPDYDTTKRWPLLLDLHGAGGFFGNLRKPAKPYPYLLASVDGRGQRGSYEALSELDVLEVLADVREHYNIDPGRIYLGGGSMGGGGTWKIACRHPDLFAALAPDFGYAGGLHLENISNIPVWNYHDDEDWAVPVDCSREAIGRLRELNCPAIYTESSGGGHSSIMFSPDWKRTDWLAAQRRDPFPPAVTYFTHTATRGKAYWIEILELADPNRIASLRARAAGNGLFLDLDNVEILAVDLPGKLFDSARPLTIKIDHAPLTVKPPLPPRVFLAAMTQPDRGRYRMLRANPHKPASTRPYSAGGMNLMYTCGEPLLIVKGTDGNDKPLLAAIDNLCQRLATKSPFWSEMPVGRIPVKSDVDITADDAARCNLIIVGPAKSNRYLAKIIGRLPVAEGDAKVTIGGETYTCQRGGYGLFYYNPNAPQRFIVVFSGFDATTFVDTVWDQIVWRMTSDQPFGFDLQTDRTMRRLAWDKQWQPAAGAFADERLPAAFASLGGLREIENAATCKAAGADFIVRRFSFGSTQPDDPAWNTASARWHDVSHMVGLRPYTLVSTVLGEELLDIAHTVADDRDKRLSLWPALSADTVGLPPPGNRGIKIDPTRQYVICGDLTSLAYPRKKNMPNVRRVYVDLLAAMRSAAAGRSQLPSP